MRKREEIEASFAPRAELDGRTRFFLVGIGGAGMSALARMLKHRGFEVTGTDSTLSPEVERLRNEEFVVQVGHSGDALADFAGDPATVAVVLTDAIDLDVSPEVAKARALGLPLFRRSQALGWLLQNYKVIAVTGTHGKTTTTGMTGAGLIAAGLDPLVVVGAAIPEWGGPVREGKGEWAVVEACEAYDAFHDLDPTIVILTNLELDHVDYHGSYDNLRKSVLRFVNRVPAEGKLVFCGDDPGAAEIAELTSVPTYAYGHPLTERQLTMPGRHNRLNGAGALAAADAVSNPTRAIDLDKAMDGIAAFRGAERRLQVLQEGEITVIDDYAHHPTEIEASLQAVRSRYAGRRLVVVFQPHLYSRTAPLICEFAQALDHADVVVLTDIYPAREAPMPGISSARIAEHLEKPTVYVPSRHQLPMKVAAMAQAGDVIVGMGAGNIAEFAPSLIATLERKKRPTKIAVLAGGDSAEREISILSGRAVHAALKERGHDADLLDATELLLGTGSVKRLQEYDVAFLAIHGTHSEDGATQGLLELLGIPYTGSGIQASAIAMDKAMTKRVLSGAGVRVPQGVMLRSMDDEVPLPPPLVVKPNAQGSTVGLRFVEKGSELCPALANAFQYDTTVVVEEWVRGMEISVPVLLDEPLPPVEIAPASGRYDFEHKYTPGATQEIIPARLPEAVLEQAKALALKCHRVLGCEGATRTDIIVVDAEGDAKLYVLEVNTLPGMTSTSLLPNSARAAGISFGELCEKLVEDALRRHGA